jgi:hypothetical protein
MSRRHALEFVLSDGKNSKGPTSQQDFRIRAMGLPVTPNSRMSAEIVENRILLLRYIGKHEPSEWYRFVLRAVEDPDLPRDYAVVVDIRQSTEKYAFADLEQRARFWLSLRPRLKALATVVDTPFGKEAMGQVDAILSFEVATATNFAVFDRIDEAIGWAKSWLWIAQEDGSKRSRSLR